MPAIKKGKKATEAAPRAVQPITKREEHVDEEVSTEEVSDVEEEAMKEEEEDAEDGAEYTIDEGGDTHVAADGDHQASRQEQKRLKLERKQQKPHYDLISEAKRKWDVLRRKTTTDEKLKQKLLGDLMRLFDNKWQEVVLKHDASRIIQTMIKQGTPEQRVTIAQALKGTYVHLAQQPYGKFVVLKLLRFCPTERRNIIRSFYGHVRKLILHKISSNVLEDIYVVYANAQERASLVEEFLGPEFSLFKSDETRTLASILESHPTKKEAILRDLTENLIQILNKGTQTHSIVHRALLEYFTHASREQQLRDLVPLLAPCVSEIIHTKEGAKVGIKCLAITSAKERKVLVKGMKQFIVKIAKDQYGCVVLSKGLECIDDTVLVGKSWVDEMCKATTELLFDPFGRKVFMTLLKPRAGRWFEQDIREMLSETDEITAVTSKKDAAVRRKELLQYLLPHLVASYKEHMRELVRDKQTSLLFAELLRVLHELQKEEELRMLLDLLSTIAAETVDAPEAFTPSSTKHAVVLSSEKQSTEHVFVDQAANQLLKTMLKEKLRLMTEKLDTEQAVHWLQQTTGSTLVMLSLFKAASKEELATWRSRLKGKIAFLKKEEKDSVRGEVYQLIEEAK